MMQSLVPEQLSLADVALIVGGGRMHLYWRSQAEHWPCAQRGTGWRMNSFYTAGLPGDVRAAVMHHYRRIRLARGRAR